MQVLVVSPPPGKNLVLWEFLLYLHCFCVWFFLQFGGSYYTYSAPQAYPFDQNPCMRRNCTIPSRTRGILGKNLYLLNTSLVMYKSWYWVASHPLSFLSIWVSKLFPFWTACCRVNPRSLSLSCARCQTNSFCHISNSKTSGNGQGCG